MTEVEEREYKILVVDDDLVVRNSFEAILRHLGYIVLSVDDGEGAFNLCRTNPDIDLIFMDIYMPNMNGFEAIKLIQEIRADVPIIIITGESSIENALEAIKIGAYDFVPKPITNYKILDITIRRALEFRNQLLREQQYKRDLQQEILKKTELLRVKNDQLEENIRNLEKVTVEVISSFMEMMEQKDSFLAGHTRNVTEICRKFSRVLHLSEKEVQLLVSAAKLHDIGKLVIPERILTKKEALEPGEWIQIKAHPERAAVILKPLEFMGELREIILQHHERYDGKGYPHGLAGEKINYFARVLSLANAYDAMVSDRPYREGLDSSDAITEIELNKGKQFDPALADLFIGWLRTN